MRISDWSSDVCSSDLGVDVGEHAAHDMAFALHALGADDRARRARLGHRAVAAVVVVNVDRRVRQRGAEAGDRLPNRGFLVVAGQQDRSEEHTSELQSLMRISYAVFCLKKKTTT